MEHSCRLSSRISRLSFSRMQVALTNIKFLHIGEFWSVWLLRLNGSRIGCSAEYREIYSSAFVRYDCVAAARFAVNVSRALYRPCIVRRSQLICLYSHFTRLHRHHVTATFVFAHFTAHSAHFISFHQGSPEKNPFFSFSLLTHFSRIHGQLLLSRYFHELTRVKSVK